MIVGSLWFLTSSLYAESLQSYQQTVKQSFTNYKKNSNDSFLAYKQAQEHALKEFKKELKLHWKDPQSSTKYKWVEYSKNLKNRKSIDFKNHMMNFEVHAKNRNDAMQKFSSMFQNTLDENITTANKRDLLEHKIAKILHKKIKPIISPEKIIAQHINKKDLRKIKNEFQLKNVHHYTYQKQNIYTIAIALPNRVMAKNAMRFQKEILIASSKEQIPISLIYAIIHSESAFNPMARSNVPAFGLMQIVPKTAGLDSYYYLYGYKKLLSAPYLYLPDNNIRIGTAYLHILYYKYLKNITNTQSRLYCTIAAYNTGSGNVARAFTNRKNISTAIKKINRLTPNEVYNILLSNLPYDETKHYLKIVNQRRNMYQKIFYKKG